MDEPAEEQPEITVPEEHAAGVWANTSRITFSEHEFTVDFVRLDPWEPGRGVVVARVSASVPAIAELMDNLRAVWHAWLWKSMPREALGDDDGAETE